MKNLKKLFSATIVSSMMLGLVACGSDKSAKNEMSGIGAANTENKIEVAKENVSEYVFRQDDGFNMSGIEGNKEVFLPVNDSVYVAADSSIMNIASKTEATAKGLCNYEGTPIEADNVARIYKVSKDGGNAEVVYETSADKKGSESIVSLFTGNDGTLYFVKNTSEGSVVCQLTDGGANEIGPADKLSAEPGIAPEKVCVDKDGNFIGFLGNNVKILDSSFNEKASLTTDDVIDMCGIDANGEAIIATDSYDETPVITIHKIDANAGKFTDEYVLDISVICYGRELCKGTDGYDFFYSTDSAVYGYKYDGNTATKIASFGSSDINSAFLGRVFITDQNTFYMDEVSEDNARYTGEVKKYVKVDPSEIEDKTVLTLSSLSGSANLKKAVVEFNKSQNDIKVELIEYSDSSDPSAKFSADISAGLKPDLYEVSDGLGDLTYKQCVTKEMLEDLKPYYEKDEEINPSDLIPSVYEAMQIDGKMYFVSAQAKLNTLFAGKSEQLGDNSGWTVSEMKAYVEAQPEESRMFQEKSKNGNLKTFLNGSLEDYVNWEKGECYFDSQDFMDLLAMCNRGTTEDAEVAQEDCDFNTVPTGQVLFAYEDIGMESLQYYNEMYGNNMCIKGFPNKDKVACTFNFRDAIAMSSQSEHKEEAWKFLRFILSDEYQGKIYHSKYDPGFPTREDVYAAYVERNTATESYKDKYGNDIEPLKKDEYQMGAFEWVTGPISKEEADTFRSAVDNAKGMNIRDKKINEIVREEAAAYFTGDKSVDDVCMVIQDRVTTYINESK